MTVRHENRRSRASRVPFATGCHGRRRAFLHGGLARAPESRRCPNSAGVPEIGAIPAAGLLAFPVGAIDADNTCPCQSGGERWRRRCIREPLRDDRRSPSPRRRKTVVAQIARYRPDRATGTDWTTKRSCPHASEASPTRDFLSRCSPFPPLIARRDPPSVRTPSNPTVSGDDREPRNARKSVGGSLRRNGRGPESTSRRTDQRYFFGRTVLAHAVRDTPGLVVVARRRARRPETIVWASADLSRNWLCLVVGGFFVAVEPAFWRVAVVGQSSVVGRSSPSAGAASSVESARN